MGYWHTHPEPLPKLSNIDLSAFRKNLIDGGVHIERMLVIVIGNSDQLETINISVLDIDVHYS